MRRGEKEDSGSNDKISIQEKMQIEGKYRLFFNSMTEAVIVHRLVYDDKGEPIDYRIVDINPAYEQIFGIKYKDVVGKLATEVYNTPTPPLFDMYLNVVRTGNPISFEYYFPNLKKQFFISSFHTEGDEFVSIVTDITEIERERAKNRHLYSILEAIRNVNQLITRVKTKKELIEQTCEKLQKAKNYNAVFIFLFDESGNIELSANAGLDEKYSKLIELKKNGYYPPCIIKALEEKNIFHTKKTRTFCGDCSLAQLYAASNIIVSPLIHNNRLYGLLEISTNIESPEYSIDEEKLIEEISGDIAFAIHSIEINEERERAEEELKRQKEFSDRIIQASNAIIIGLDSEHRIEIFSDGAQKITGWERAEVLGKDWFEIFFDSKLAEEMKAVWSDAWGRKFHSYINPICTKNGEERIISWNNTSICDEYGEPRLLVCIGQDITDRIEVQEQLRQSEERYRTVIHQSAEAIYLADPKSKKIVEANSKFFEYLGYEREEISSLTMYDFIAHSKKSIDDLVQKTLETGTFIVGERKWKRKDGKLIDVIISSGKIEQDSEKLLFIMALDITDRIKARKALFSEKERLKVTLKSIGDAVISTDTKGKIVLMNKVAEELTGWNADDAVGKPLNDVFHIINEETGEVCENPVEKVIKTGFIVGLANGSILISKDGTRRYIADSGAPVRDNDGNIIGVVLVFRDITEKLRTEKELQKINRLQSLGVFAGGIAHDFNNILTAFLLNVSHAKLLSEGNEKIVEILTDAEKATMRAQSLTQKLLTFSRGGAPIKETIDVSKIIKDAAEFVLAGSNVRCNFSISDDLWLVDADEGQIAQVIQNIVINADQSMPEGGLMDISAENIIVGEDEHPVIKPGKYIKITIKDNGIGIPKEYIGRIFDPYFTTKQTGNGLGLAIVYSIVRQHGGYVDVDSVVEKGTTFDIYLPASKEKSKKVRIPESEIAKYTGKVLLMDDETKILDIVGKILHSYGNEVETASDGEEAIQKYLAAKNSQKPFDVVILDLTVRGGMGGKMTIEKLREIDPNVKAIVSSGYSHDPIMANYKDYGFAAVIAKPYRPQKLRETISKIIAEKNADSK